MNVDAGELIQQGLDQFGIASTPTVIDRLFSYVLELERWNKRINLTGKQGTEPIIRELLYDAFFLYSIIEHAATLLDVGSGNGILAITFACLNDELQVYAVDKNLKKIQFQKHIKRRLKLRGLLPLHGRIEALEPLNVDTVVAKGFAPTVQVLDKASIHLLRGGSVYLLKGMEDEGTVHQNFILDKVFPYRLPQSPKQYRLLLYKKIS